MAVARKRKPAKRKVAKKPAKRKPAARKTTARKKPATRKAAAKRTTARKKTTAKKRVVRRATTRKPAARKTAARKKPKSKRKPNPAFMRPMTLSPDLGAVVGAKPIPRTEVTKKLWLYIKRHKLQDNVNRRMINADDNLRRVFGGKRKVSMFEMTKLISKHMK